MSDEVLNQPADFTIDLSGSLQANESVMAVRERINELKVAEDMINAAFCGALIVGLFRQHDWLDGLDLDLSARSEYDDGGGSYRCTSVTVEQVRIRNGRSVPDAILETGSDSAIRVEDAMLECLEDHAGDLYAALRDEADYSTFSLRFERAEVADLLNEPLISGREAFIRLFADYAYLIERAEGLY